MSPDVCVTHLVWAPLGPERLRAFIESYRSRDAGSDHRLLVLLNGFERNDDLGPWRAELDGVTHEELLMPEPMLDLAAYSRVVEEVAATHYCFLNSYSVLLADAWLARLLGALDDDRVGAAAASGSWASRSSHLRLGLGLGGPYVGMLGSPAKTARTFRALASEGERRAGGPLKTARAIPSTLVRFPPFPNPHLRSNAFVIEHKLWKALRLATPSSKQASYLIESGKHSITRQIEALGLRAVVVGRDGVAYVPDQWPQSETFWQAEQGNLLVSDNQTATYAGGDLDLRTTLSRYAWGGAANPADGREKERPGRSCRY